jgi:hypothetical protein
MSEKIQSYPGKALTRDEMTSGVLSVGDETGFRYAWSAGVAVGRFLEGLRRGKIYGRECEECSRILVPPRVFCEECFRRTDRWVEVADTGRVITYSISHVGTDASRLDTPIVVAVVELDGASKGMGFMHVLGEVDPDEVSIGMRIEAVWKPEDSREGSITDIRYFRPRGVSA